jgi:hypothetical protein
VRGMWFSTVGLAPAEPFLYIEAIVKLVNLVAMELYDGESHSEPSVSFN